MLAMSWKRTRIPNDSARTESSTSSLEPPHSPSIVCSKPRSSSPTIVGSTAVKGPYLRHDELGDRTGVGEWGVEDGDTRFRSGGKVHLIGVDAEATNCK